MWTGLISHFGKFLSYFNTTNYLIVVTSCYVTHRKNGKKLDDKMI